MLVASLEADVFIMLLSFHIVSPILRIYFRTAVNSTRRISNVTKVAQQCKEVSNLSFEEKDLTINSLIA